MNKLPDLSHSTEIVITQPAEENPYLTYMLGLAKSSRKSLSYALKVIARIVAGTQEDENVNPALVEWWKLRRGHMLAIQEKLSETLEASTVNTYMYALKGVLKECWRLGLLTYEEYHRVTDIKALSSSRKKADAVDPKVVKKLIDRCMEDENLKGLRDAAVIAILYNAGLRRQELCDLVNDDIEIYEDGYRIKVMSGKGDKFRITFVSGRAARLLEALLDASPTGHILFNIDTLDASQPLHTQTVYDILKARCAQIEHKMISPHKLRGAFATNLLLKGVDTFVVQRLMGHSDPKTTEIYDRRGEDIMFEGVRSLGEDI